MAKKTSSRAGMPAGKSAVRSQSNKKQSKKAKSKAVKETLRRGERIGKGAGFKARPQSGSKRDSAAVVIPPSFVSRDHHLALATWSHAYVVKVANAFADGNTTTQAPGVPNHALWTVGHLAVTNAWMYSLLTGEKSSVPATYDAMFNMGTIPHQDASQYPSFDEVKKVYDESFEQIASIFRSMNDAELFKPCVQDSQGFVTSKMDVMSKTAWHEGWHIGQLVDLRRALSLARGY